MNVLHPLIPAFCYEMPVSRFDRTELLRTTGVLVRVQRNHRSMISVLADTMEMHGFRDPW